MQGGNFHMRPRNMNPQNTINPIRQQPLFGANRPNMNVPARFGGFRSPNMNNMRPNMNQQMRQRPNMNQRGGMFIIYRVELCGDILSFIQRSY